MGGVLSLREVVLRRRPERRYGRGGLGMREPARGAAAGAGCGLFPPAGNMAGWLPAPSRMMPLRCAAEGMTELTGAPTVVGAITFRRRIA
jgi:hypothetical protein